eukprot:jgi/Picsp_1/4094/NSC_01604-R1_sister chromatid cohesion protein pds5-like protein
MNGTKDTGTKKKQGTVRKSKGKGRPPKPKPDEDDVTTVGLARKRKKVHAQRKNSPNQAVGTHVNCNTLIGQRIAVFWPAEKTYYFGTILKFHATTGTAFVHFDDGEEIKMSLDKERWLLVDVPGQQVSSGTLGSPLVDKHPLDTKYQALIKGHAYSVFRTCAGRPGYEIFASLPGHLFENIMVRCSEQGTVILRTRVGGTDVMYVELPTRIDPGSAHSFYAGTGQLYVRVDAVPEKLSP